MFGEAAKKLVFENTEKHIRKNNKLASKHKHFIIFQSFVYRARYFSLYVYVLSAITQLRVLVGCNSSGGYLGQSMH